MYILDLVKSSGRVKFPAGGYSPLSGLMIKSNPPEPVEFRRRRLKPGWEKIFHIISIPSALKFSEGFNF